MLYPYKIRIRDEEIDKILTRLAHDRTVTLKESGNHLMKLGQKLRPIRKDIFIGVDRNTLEKNISIKNPMLKLEKDEFKKLWTFRF